MGNKQSQKLKQKSYKIQDFDQSNKNKKMQRKGSSPNNQSQRTQDCEKNQKIFSTKASSPFLNCQESDSNIQDMDLKSFILSKNYIQNQDNSQITERIEESDSEIDDTEETDNFQYNFDFTKNTKNTHKKSTSLNTYANFQNPYFDETQPQ
ncbi:hypothetical protein PPERSA_03659 [Pseudocohnilembus persalinus]|uniref:Uncharacterized protein n=1 Tax=Pseudocohnilembus persalinus TaxID=266149 RepID=A0A0V0QN53_PSEPJ|nr:hypothetical protein PPERSA_03659 [Pseudocohnilembus persalinus]|eukprot:KRX03698.1 hypothetical protein PPERSA_03659 [Pseudocohnilembus persalinus]